MVYTQLTQTTPETSENIDLKPNNKYKLKVDLEPKGRRLSAIVIHLI